VVGLYQGAAETGPRALGHRSILANPCNPRTLETINLRVKFREPIRPLAPMATLAAAQRFFELSPGAADDDYNAYNYMVLTTRARPEAYAKIPAVVHKDGTARVQIVREEHDPFTYAYLRAMGRRLGVEVSVNTSLNVGSPIVQTPVQALAALKRAKAMSGLVMIAADGQSWFVWPAVSPCPEAVRAWMAPCAAAVP
jgi:carbamoyltransferase